MVLVGCGVMPHSPMLLQPADDQVAHMPEVSRVYHVCVSWARGSVTVLRHGCDYLCMFFSTLSLAVCMAMLLQWGFVCLRVV